MLSLRRVSAAAATAVRRPSTAARSLLVVAPVSARSLHLEASKPSITAAIETEPVIVFSKTHCPFCSRVKELFADLDVKHEVIELDVRADGAEIQELLRELTGQRTVPNVFIRGRHIGGCDATLDLHARDELLPLLK